MKDLGLVIDSEDPCLACSLDGLVDIPGKGGGIVEIKCPYKAAKEGLDPVSAAKTMKNLFNIVEAHCYVLITSESILT